MHKKMSGMLKMLVLLLACMLLGCSVACAGSFSDDPDAIEAAAQSVLTVQPSSPMAPDLWLWKESL